MMCILPSTIVLNSPLKLDIERNPYSRPGEKRPREQEVQVHSTVPKPGGAATAVQREKRGGIVSGKSTVSGDSSELAAAIWGRHPRFRERSHLQY